MEFEDIVLSDTEVVMSAAIFRQASAVYGALTHEAGTCMCADTARILLEMANWPEELFLYQFDKGLLDG